MGNLLCRSEMRNVCFTITLEYIINTSDIRQIDSPGGWPIKDSIFVNTHNLLRAQSLKFSVIEGQPFLNKL